MASSGCAGFLTIYLFNYLSLGVQGAFAPCQLFFVRRRSYDLPVRSALSRLILKFFEYAREFSSSAELHPQPGSQTRHAQPRFRLTGGYH